MFGENTKLHRQNLKFCNSKLLTWKFDGLVNSFNVTGLFLYPMKASENQIYILGDKKETSYINWVN